MVRSVWVGLVVWMIVLATSASQGQGSAQSQVQRQVPDQAPGEVRGQAPSQHGALISILAGSGSSVLGIFEDQKVAEKALADSPVKGLLSRTSTLVAPVEIV